MDDLESPGCLLKSCDINVADFVNDFYLLTVTGEWVFKQ